MREIVSYNPNAGIGFFFFFLNLFFIFSLIRSVSRSLVIVSSRPALARALGRFWHRILYTAPSTGAASK
jgi:hypothetical protein